jgi:histidinol-phosphate aminotransferase
MSVRARPVPEGFEPYIWASTPEEVAARRGLRPEMVIRYDANVPPLPGVPQIPLGESFARANEYPEGTYRELREAAAGYVGVDPDWIVPDAGADGVIALVAQTFLGPGRRAAIAVPTYPLYAIASGIEGAEVVPFEEEADVVWLCNPNNPTGDLLEPEDVARLARGRPDAVVAVDEAYFEYCGKSIVPLIADVPNLIAIRTVSKAFGFAALRVGFAVAAPEVARELEFRREPGPIGTLAAKIASAALREPRFDVEEAVVERERMRSALLGAGYDVPHGNANFVLIREAEAPALADRLEEQGLVVRRYPEAIRITVRIPAENDLILAALGAAPQPAAARSALVVKTTAETALRLSLSLDGQGRARVDTGIGFLDHLLAQLAFHGGLDLELLAGGDLGVDEHHTVEDVLAALGDALGQALGSRDGLARYGSATVPMDEARATAAVDLVRRPHAEVSLAFKGERVGGLAPTLLPHALERFAQQAVLTLHVEGSGEDDHHLAEAAFKVLGRALREAIAPGAGGIRSTKGSL